MKKIENDHNMPQRWERSDEIYVKYLECHQRDSLKQLKEQLRAAVENRYFLLRQKAKYAGKLLDVYLFRFFLNSFQMAKKLQINFRSKLQRLCQP